MNHIIQSERWVFAYGSLMWSPGFTFVERVEAVLSGFHRDFCVRAIKNRGTPALPGLVLGTVEKQGSFLHGIAYRVDDAVWPAVHNYLIAREQANEAYLERYLDVVIADTRVVRALVYVADIDHPHWAGGLTIGEKARAIVRASGLAGSNIEYLKSLHIFLNKVNIRDSLTDSLIRECELYRILMKDAISDSLV